MARVKRVYDMAGRAVFTGDLVIVPAIREKSPTIIFAILVEFKTYNTFEGPDKTFLEVLAAKKNKHGEYIVESKIRHLDLSRGFLKVYKSTVPYGLPRKLITAVNKLAS